jgi:DNA-binding beta-propeller fold protein YncE
MEFPARAPRSFGQGEHDAKFARFGMEGIASAGGLLYVSDSHNNSIVITQLDGKPMGTLTTAADANLSLPSGLDIFEDELYVVDGGNCRIAVFSLTSEATRAFGSVGHTNGCFDQPEDVFVFNDGPAGPTLLVADTGNHRIVVTRSDGTFVRAFGRHGSGFGEFDFPTSVAMSNDVVFVTDHHNNRVVMTDLLGSVFNHVDTRGSAFEDLLRPVRLLANDAGVLVSDSGNGRLLQLAADGTAVEEIEIPDDGSGIPCAMCLCDDGGMFVTEIDTMRVVYIPPRR